MGIFEIRSMIFDRRLSRDGDVDRWHTLHHWKPVWIFLLFLCVSVTSSCGPSSSSATTVGQPPQPSADAHPFHDTFKTLDGDFTITLDITPNRSGINVFMAQVMDTRTKTSAAHIAITLYTTMQDMPMGTDSILLRAGNNGQFSATSNTLSMDGHWAIGITIQTPDHIIHKAGVSLLTSL